LLSAERVVGEARDGSIVREEPAPTLKGMGVLEGDRSTAGAPDVGDDGSGDDTPRSLGELLVGEGGAEPPLDPRAID
jgi:hypothetical protein